MKLLDLFCGAGGAAMGYSRAGFTQIVGVDNRPQKHYPLTFIQADALDVLYALAHGDCWPDQTGRDWHLEDFDAIHASPPCQGWVRGLSAINKMAGRKHTYYYGRPPSPSGDYPLTYCSKEV